MSSPVARSASVLRGVGTLFRVGVAAGLEEGALLERFRSSGDEAAFAALVALHGPRVLGVCRRLLRDPHEAEDAFQATFLVLARKAGAIRRPSQLGGWLHGVARRVAGKAHVARARRQRHEATAAGRGATQDRGGLGEDREELRSILDEELDRLPEAYRQAVTLCYVEGKTVDEAATALGWPRGTVGTRLARGRERLRSRLERRGVAPALALAAPRPTLPSSLADSTTRAAIRFAADGAAAAGAVSARIVATALAVSRGMTMRKLVTIATTILATALVGAGFFAHAAVGRPDEKPKPASAAKGDREAIQDTWIVTGCTVNGMQFEVLEAQIEGSKFEFKGDRATVTMTAGAPGPLVFGVKIDPAASPKALTLESIEPQPGRKMVAIYELTPGDRLRIGFVDALARGVRFIMNGANHQMNGISTYPFGIFANGWESAMPAQGDLPYKGDTVIGNDVWMGYEALVMPGVSIGDGAIVAACSVVSADVPPYTIVAGNPARPVRARFDTQTVRRLTAIAWWDRPVEWISAHLDLIRGADVDALERALP